jgi:hypothetical protein
MIVPMLLSFPRAALTSAATLLLCAGCATKPAPPPETTQTKPAAAPPTIPGKFPASGSLFDGQTLAGWVATDFAGRGPVTVEKGQINLGMGHMTGITWTNDLPRMNYEISLDAQRVDGSDFFCGLTFPVGKDPCSFIVGGWGGGVVGLSSIDSEDASQNETTSYMNFVNGRWYHIRVRVEPGKIQAWIDEDRVVNLDTADKRLSIRLEVEPCTPLGIATWNTAAALKNLQLKKL